MAIDIQKYMEDRIAKSSQAEASLSDRLRQMEEFQNQVPISMEGRPKGLNPMIGLDAWLKGQSNRNSLIAQQGQQEDVTGNWLLKMLDYEKSNQSDPYKEREMALKEKEAGVKYNYETGEYEPVDQVSKEKQQIINDIDEVLGRDVGALVGMPNPFKIGENITTKQKIEQIKSKLGLDARKALKGSGQISDYEMKILEKSVGALNYRMSNKDFIAELNKIKSVLGGTYSEEDNQVGGFTIKQVK